MADYNNLDNSEILKQYFANKINPEQSDQQLMAPAFPEESSKWANEKLQASKEDLKDAYNYSQPAGPGGSSIQMDKLSPLDIEEKATQKVAQPNDEAIANTKASRDAANSERDRVIALNKFRAENNLPALDVPEDANTPQSWSQEGAEPLQAQNKITEQPSQHAGATPNNKSKPTRAIASEDNTPDTDEYGIALPGDNASVTQMYKYNIKRQQAINEQINQQQKDMKWTNIGLNILDRLGAGFAGASGRQYNPNATNGLREALGGGQIEELKRQQAQGNTAAQEFAKPMGTIEAAKIGADKSAQVAAMNNAAAFERAKLKAGALGGKVDAKTKANEATFKTAEDSIDDLMKALLKYKPLPVMGSVNPWSQSAKYDDVLKNTTHSINMAIPKARFNKAIQEVIGEGLPHGLAKLSPQRSILMLKRLKTLMANERLNALAAAQSNSGAGKEDYMNDEMGD